jgi:DNA-binding transcriptional LysR family regulator
MPALPDFHRRYPDIQIDMGVSDRNIDVIGENVDCVVRGGEITVPSLVAHVGDLPLGVYAAPAICRNRARPRIRRNWNGTAPHRRFPALQQRHHRTTNAAQEESCKFNARYTVAADDGNAYLAAGLAGMGVLWLPRYMAEPMRRAANSRRYLKTGRRTHADVPRLPAEPPPQRQAARVHGMDRRVDGDLVLVAHFGQREGAAVVSDRSVLVRVVAAVGEVGVELAELSLACSRGAQPCCCPTTPRRCSTCRTGW